MKTGLTVQYVREKFVRIAVSSEQSGILEYHCCELSLQRPHKNVRARVEINVLKQHKENY